MISLLVNVCRDLASVIHPLTGTRATGTVTVKSSTGTTATVDVGSYLVPVVDGAYRDDLAYKVNAGPNADKSWTITAAGVNVGVTANLGGARFNLPAATSLYFDPAITNIASSVVTGAITTGANPTSLGIQDIQIFERFDPSPESVDLTRSSIRRFPSAILAWVGSEPADGSAVSQTSQSTRAGRGRVIYHELFDFYLFTNAMSSDHLRRQDGLRLLDAATMLFTSRRSSDGVGISAPSGVQVRRRWRHNFADHKGVQRYYAYGLELAAMTTYNRTDTRSYTDLESFVIDVIKPQIPTLPNQGDYTVVDGMDVDNT